MPKNAKKAEPEFQDSFSNELLDSRDLALTISEALKEKKGEDIQLLDVGDLTTLTDYFVVCHATTDVQIKALANSVIMKAKEEHDENVWQKEGMESRRWVILDYVNVVVHIFNKQQREYYGFERMWNDAEITYISDD